VSLQRLPDRTDTAAAHLTYSLHGHGLSYSTTVHI
jgi:hypothetical protein